VHGVQERLGARADRRAPIGSRITRCCRSCVIVTAAPSPLPAFNL